MPVADEQAYEEMINALSQFISDISEECGRLSTAASDCVDNLQGDVNAQKMAVSLNEKLKAIYATTGKASSIRTALQKELQMIQESKNTNFD